MKLNYIDVLYLAATHKKWPVHGKKQISEAMTKMFLKKEYPQLSEKDIYKLSDFVSKMTNVGYNQQNLKRAGVLTNENKESAKSFPAGCASACSHKKSGKVEWYCDGFEAERFAKKMYEKYYKDVA
tara:strand:- start:680 stop:1057 length:378 start_codon:yes stop_codon:yes gene_type:complete